MVLADSHRISHVPRYSGYRPSHSNQHTGLSPYFAHLSKWFCWFSIDLCLSYNPNLAGTRLVWAVPRSLAATRGITNCFLFLRLLRCFSSPGSLLYVYLFNVRYSKKEWVSPFGNLRVTACLPANRSLSQATTSFIACNRQGIHDMHLFTWPYNTTDCYKD